MFSFLSKGMLAMLSPEESPPPSVEEPIEIFQNHLILENLFKFYSFTELCQARLVCHLWHYASLPYWRSKGSVCLYPKQTDALYERKKYVTISDFLEIIEDVNSAPGDSEKARYRVAGWPYMNFKLHLFRDTKKNRFWTECGPWVSSLELVCCHLPNYVECRNILLSTYTPNLRSFKISYGNSLHRISNSYRETIQTSKSCQRQNFNLKSLSFFSCLPELPWMEMLSCYPAIETLEVSYPVVCLEWEDNLIEMLTAITSIRRRCKSKLNLKCMRVLKTDHSHRPSLSSPLYQLLADLSLTLESLILDTEFFVNGLSLKIILSAYQSTLKKLKLYGSYILTDHTRLDFPQLPQLIHLEEFTLTAFAFRNMDILQYTPNLKLLHIIDQWRSRPLNRFAIKTFLNCSRTVKLELVKDLRYDFVPTAVDLFRLITWVPFVERLEMPLNNETFRVVCQYWPNLVKLEIQRDRLDDNGIIGNCTGLPEITGRGDFQKYFKISHENQPNIKHLKYLNTFIMTNQRYRNDDEDVRMQRYNDFLPSKLTDRSITHGFLHVPYLQKLYISVDENFVSEKVVASLKKVVPEVTVLRLTNAYYTSGSPPD